MTQELYQPDSDPSPTASNLPVFAPPVDIYENEAEILVVADLPGVLPDDVSVRLVKGQLDLEASQRSTAESLPAVHFARSFRVPETVDPAAVVAELKEGVLRLRLGKAASARPRRIKVTSG